MEKFVVVSTNNNPDYYSYAKYIEKAWAKYGWSLCVVMTHDVNPRDLELKDAFFIQMPDIPELKRETIAQAGRLYAANYLPKGALVMTSDMDLLPLSDYWHPEPNVITIFGHDLTDYTYIPMGYVAMTTEKWQSVMELTYDTKRDLLRDSRESFIKNNPYSDKWEVWWGFDWDLLTNRLTSYKLQAKFITRGRGHSGFAYGRVDRGDSCQIPIGENLVDAHLENHNVKAPEKWNKFISLFESHYGKL